MDDYENWEEVLERPLREIVQDLEQVDSHALTLLGKDADETLAGGIVLLRGAYTQRLLDALDREIKKIVDEEAQEQAKELAQAAPASPSVH